MLVVSSGLIPTGKKRSTYINEAAPLNRSYKQPDTVTYIILAAKIALSVETKILGRVQKVLDKCV